ncbi:MAG TPA: hypothetical protein VNO30_32135 [Kofleriaceae bacterium]|nr:hypothetical protein [Kofleriaceae bacterium]
MSAALAGGCAGSGTVYYGGGGTLTATTVAPDLVYVSPGVQVVADYEYPVFYADNFYWRFDNGRWYRSSWYTGGWAYASPPYAVTRIEQPYAYRHYRPTGYVSRREYRDYRRPVYRDTRPVYRDSGPAVRDHRDNRAPVYRDTRPVYRDSGPAVRDHREYRAPAAAPAPAVRDHRTERAAPVPSARDHRTERGSVNVRDHRR